MERERFVDKIALVTGGANGLGRGMVEQLVKEGAQVAIFDIEDDTMEEVFGGNDHVFCVHCDVRDYDQKAAVKMLTQVMALELAKYGIHVNAIAPGTSKTRIAAGTINDPERSAAFLAKMPFGRYGEVRETVDVALFLASEDASFITGETIYNEGGFSLT